MNKEKEMMLSWTFESLIGGRSENQDFYGHCETRDGSRLFVVCDGMGGMRGGSIASKEAVRIILEEAIGSLESNPERLLTTALKKANALIFQLGQSKEELRGMGTTVVALLISREKATTAHVGDSRIYQIRGKRKIFRTFDHSVVFELVKQGKLSEEQARISSDSNLISRALGMKPEVEPEITGNLSYRKGDRFMLCTDGISGVVEEKKLLKMIAVGKSVETTAKNVTAQIDNLGVQSGGGHDNLTIALIDVKTNSTIKPVADKRYKLIITILLFLLLVSIGLNIYKFL